MGRQHLTTTSLCDAAVLTDSVGRAGNTVVIRDAFRAGISRNRS
jgi:hypothetical protein